MKLVAILGGGPAGAFAAERLASAGLDTIVFDEKGAWEKPCGGGLTYKAYHTYPFLIENNTPKKMVAEMVLAAPRAKAATLFQRFNAAFWNEAEGYYAYALDGDKRPVLSVASNPGHLLWSGIVPPDRAARVVARLMQPDMWSGWGIRTLSADHPSYNPYSYQNGSVWPHDNGLIAQGFKRYGFADAANQVAHDLIHAAKFFMLNQLPELYAGIERENGNFPVQYLGANVPQAWAAGSVFSLLQAMIGFQPDAPNGVLAIDPSLPEWLPDLIVRDLRMGDQCFDIRFTRLAGRTIHEVLRGDKNAVVRRPMTVWTPVEA